MFHRQSLDSRVIEERKDNNKTSRLISEFKPFIASVAQKRAGKFLNYGVDEELSIALSAFKEAMDSFDIKKGKFLNFARRVIDMRLIDHYRRQKRKKTYSFDTDSYPDTDLMSVNSLEQYKIDNEKEKRILEIIEYRAELEKWGISLEELAEISPRNNSLREEYIKIARAIVKNSHILENLMKTKRLPLKEIEEIVLVHRKKLERGRIYIIAMVLAIINNLGCVDISRGDKR